MAERYDAVIIGGGHNGLISAAYLARAGMKTLVLESRHVLGGAAVTEEIVPGFRFSAFSYVVSLLRPEIIRDLRLPQHGLDILPLDGTFTPLDGDYLWRANDHGRTMRELRRWSASDAEAYEEYGQLMVEMARFIKPILGIVPPDPTGRDPREFLPLAGLVRTFQQLPERQQAVFVQLMTMSASDFLDQWFETDPLKATMSASGIIGTYLGVRSPGTAYVLLHHYMGEIDGAFRAWGIPKGGTGGVSQAIASRGALVGRGDPHRGAGRAHPDQGRSSHRRRARERRGDRRRRPSSPRPTSGARSCSSSSRARSTPEFEAEVKRFRFRGSSGKVNLAVDRLPDFTCLPGEGEHLRGAISFSPSVDYMERAYDDAKYGRFSRRPYIDMIIPTLVDPTMAPPGKHVISCFVQYAPYKLDPSLGTWDDQREAFGDAVIDTIAERAPNIRDIIIGRQVHTPLDIERITGLTEGNIFQGELSLEQLFFSRPVPGYARFRTPIKDLWLCGSSTHPGGGIMGANGRLAALELLRSRGRKVA